MGGRSNPGPGRGFFLPGRNSTAARALRLKSANIPREPPCGGPAPAGAFLPRLLYLRNRGWRGVDTGGKPTGDLAAEAQIWGTSAQGGQTTDRLPRGRRLLFQSRKSGKILPDLACGSRRGVSRRRVGGELFSGFG